MVMSTLWITIMNMCYGNVAKVFNDMENYRTETECRLAAALGTSVPAPAALLPTSPRVHGRFRARASCARQTTMP